MPQIKITNTSVNRLEFAETGQRLYMDTEMRGFGVLVGKNSKAYVAQRDIAGKTRRVTIGRHGIWTATKARLEAAELLVRMSKGEDPNATKRSDKAQSITLKEAAELYFDAPKQRSEKTLKWYRDALRLHFSDWDDKPLADINRKMVYDRHQKIGKEHGPYAANAAMRTFRAIYNRAMKQHEEIPANPAINVDWFPEKPRKSAIPQKELSQVYGRIMELQNPIRRDFLLFLLFTGMRREAASVVRWEHVDLDNATLFVPNPKGGESRAFHLPLSDYLVDLLKRREDENNVLFSDSPWVFPANSRSGHIAEPKEKGLPSPHALRHTYATVANAAGVGVYDLKLLMNHSLPRGDVTSGYLNPDVEQLRKSQKLVTSEIMSAIER